MLYVIDVGVVAFGAWFGLRARRIVESDRAKGKTTPDWYAWAYRAFGALAVVAGLVSLALGLAG